MQVNRKIIPDYQMLGMETSPHLMRMVTNSDEAGVNVSNSKSVGESWLVKLAMSRKTNLCTTVVTSK